MNPTGTPSAPETPEPGSTRGRSGGGRGWTAFRVALALSALWLTGYVAFRYSVFNAPDHGTAYFYIFPASLVLAAVALVLAFRPFLLSRMPGIGGTALRGTLTAYGAVWMASGVACTLSLLEGIAIAPLGGSIDMIHMVSDHVFLPLAVATLAWAPGWLAARLGASSAVREAARSAGRPGARMPGSPVAGKTGGSIRG